VKDLKFAPLGKHFPMDMIKHKIESKDVYVALSRMQDCFCQLGIQVDFEDNPVGAKLSTLEDIELAMFFFQHDIGDVSMDIQRRRGDYLDASRYTRQIIDAAKGVFKADAAEAPRAHSAAKIREFESLLENCTKKSRTSPLPPPSSDSLMERPVYRSAVGVAPAQLPTPAYHAEDAAEKSISPWAPPTEEESLKSTLESVHGSLTSERLNQRKSGLENLEIFTDLEKTMSKTAIASSLVVLAGESPAEPAYANECKKIQAVILRILMKEDFEGDNTDMYAEMDKDIVGFMSSDKKPERKGRSRYYDNYMGGMFRHALNILSNSLEVLKVFDDGSVWGRAITQLNMSCVEQYGANALLDLLINLVGQARTKQADAYLACKALRLLCEGSGDFHAVFLKHEKARMCVEQAVKVGAYNAKLHWEASELKKFL
jgi:hypothetical protein